ncbi:beta-L-arabinofuranosidase domain-containing protein [Aestuariibaculum sediminum]|uniref:Glycoside hydrolase family 127 protein n=1 Tax=Aestuariibaculum sediminum TaxID=2770637 RepID=A0A8J6U7W9_9FLAO|nr:beta-L-arabinofuranosidase domain-containing protein [Aestuariibaculum sediminum]MBD0832558.1 glycoside hydrolase family 127 protein [Aestuariibaculum sediminum]
MKLKKLCVYFVLILSYFTQAQEGDQILDGIGETAMVLRYVFNGNLKDWSRNNLHANKQGGEAAFVDDKQFKKVLSIQGKNSAYVSIPGAALNGLESLSISGWVFMPSLSLNQFIFDFGKVNGGHILVKSISIKGKPVFKAEIVTQNGTVYEADLSELAANSWSHITVVFDAASKTLMSYVNAELSDEVKNLNVELDRLFGGSKLKNKLFLGKSLSDDNTFLEAKLYDFRVYRVALSKSQITRVYNAALRKPTGSLVNESHDKENDLQQFAADTPQLYMKYLLGLAEVPVETHLGVLPRLPRFVKGTYKKGVKGPKVRVIWPAPNDNSSVLQAGEYKITGRVAGSHLQPTATVKVIDDKTATTPEIKLDGFALDQVSLNADAFGSETKFIENRDKFIKTLVKTNPDDFLYMFRNAFGEQQPEGAEALGGWDRQETKLRGHATGHYLTAIAQAYASTSYSQELQANFQEKMEYMVNTLFDLSKKSGQPVRASGDHVSDPTAVPFGPGKSVFDSDLSTEGIRNDYWNWGEGFISAYPPDQFIMLERGATYGGQITQIWAPYYTLHKILAGLIDIYEVSGNEKALTVAEGMGSWVYARLSQLPTETLISMWNRYIAGEFGGMNESMARLYRITGNAEFLETAKLFDNIKVFFGDAGHSHGLAKNVDTYRGLHANQHIPQIIGAIEMYRHSGIPEYFHVADNFWFKTTNDYMYSIGGVAGARNPANSECFTSQPATIYENGLSAGGQNETCATYNMLKLSRNLFLFEQRAELMDYYERSLYNHILASVAENSPANTYHVPLLPGSFKHFGNPNMKGFSCCNGTAMESSTKLQNTIYLKSLDNKTLYVNLYIPSTLNWTERNVVIEQTTAFPKQDYSRLTIKGKGKFDVKVRVPQWATKGFMVKINGKIENVNAVPGTYVTLCRKWKNGDTIDLKMPFQFHLESVMDQQNIASLFYGPVLLAAQEDKPRTEWRKVTLDANDISKTIQGNPKTLEFTIDSVTYKPFYDTYGRHSVYLDVTLE